MNMKNTSLKYPIYQPLLTGKEKEYVNDCLEEGWISSLGKYIEMFEDSVSNYVGTKYAISCSSGTTALHLALLSLGIKKGDEVILPSLTFVATANAISYTGATPVFADSYENSYLINVEDVESKITDKTKAIIAVHLYGNSCEMEKLKILSSKYNLYLIEDNAEAIGTKYNNQLTGSFGDISCFSFYGNKTITTGEGGLVCTDNKNLASSIKLLKDHGLDIKANEYYTHSVIGFNYRMTNISAAIGLAQMESINEIIENKREIANFYISDLDSLKNITFQHVEENVFSTYWLCSLVCSSYEERNGLAKFLKEYGVDSRPFFVPLNELEIYKKQNEHTPVSSVLGLKGLSLPSYPGLEKKDLIYITNIIKNYFN